MFCDFFHFVLSINPEEMIIPISYYIKEYFVVYIIIRTLCVSHKNQHSFIRLKKYIIKCFVQNILKKGAMTQHLNKEATVTLKNKINNTGISIIL